MRWRIEQAEEFREEVEGYSHAKRVVLADVYQALLRYGSLPTPPLPRKLLRNSSSLVSVRDLTVRPGTVPKIG